MTMRILANADVAYIGIMHTRETAYGYAPRTRPARGGGGAGNLPVCTVRAVIIRDMQYQGAL